MGGGDQRKKLERKEEEGGRVEREVRERGGFGGDAGLCKSAPPKPPSMDHSNPSSSKEAPSGSNTRAMAACALRGGCPSDYVAVGIAAAAFLLLLVCAVYPFLVRKGPRTKSSGFWLVITQILGSFNLTLGLMMSVKFIRFDKRHPWQSCYIWAVWFEGPLGFGLLMSCRIVQAYQLYHLFVKRRLPPIRASVLLPLILLPWIGGAAFIHISKPLNSRCHMRTQWVVPVVCIHMVYVAVLFGITRAIRHIEFRFHEFKDLLRGIIVSTVAIGLWVVAYVLNEVHEDVPWVQVTSRFFLLVMVSILVMAFFSMSFSQPLLSQMSLRKRGSLEYMTMGKALGIPDSGLIQKSAPIFLNVNEPLDKLLLNKRFRQSFMDFADSCLAGESVHFYDEVHELRKIPVDDPVRRVYMARHIVEKYIVTGAEMEVNVSHRTRQEILGTQDLADPDLFNHAVIELMQLVKMNLVKDYWSSTFFLKFKEESCKESNGYDPIEHLGGWEFSPRLSCVHGGDDPFHQEHKGNSDSDV